MGQSVNLGGNRLGSGNKINVGMHGYDLSTHDLGSLFRTTMASGTLVPFCVYVGLPGDSFEFELNADVKTHPTLGPLFGSFKLQLDMFTIPMRLYNSKLHNNPLNVGMNMGTIKLPQLSIPANSIDPSLNRAWELQQVNPSSLLAYLGVRSFGNSTSDTFNRKFCAIPLLAYWDIYKNYYCNKQEDIGVVIHTSEAESDGLIDAVNYTIEPASVQYNENFSPSNNVATQGTEDLNINLAYANSYLIVDGENLEKDYMYIAGTINYKDILGVSQTFDFDDKITAVFGNIEQRERGYKFSYIRSALQFFAQYDNQATFYVGNIYTKLIGDAKSPKLKTFPLSLLDEMREEILTQDGQIPFIIGQDYKTPYTDFMEYYDPDTVAKRRLCCTQTQEGLGIKTYQSDIFNNWLRTEWIEGDGSIAYLTRIDTTSGYFEIDQLNLSTKLYNLLNRVAVSGGDYKAWIESVYDINVYFNNEIPHYEGGLIKEIVFQEITSSASTETTDEKNPLGSLAGKGTLAKKHKGGHVYIKIKEPSYIMGIVSITPRIDYSQGNEWHVNLQSINDLHKPAFDQIGFQDLLQEHMAGLTTKVAGGVPTYKSAGKQPAWLHYMTNYNKVYGNFANPDSEMFMTLNRRYEYEMDDITKDISIKDLTTYVDPAKYNFIFAQTELDAQNFWVQIAVDCESRRKMSAKLIPNL